MRYRRHQYRQRRDRRHREFLQQHVVARHIGLGFVLELESLRRLNDFRRRLRLEPIQRIEHVGVADGTGLQGQFARDADRFDTVLGNGGEDLVVQI